jgi:hypothetical protein
MNSVSVNRQSPIRISSLAFNDPQQMNKFADNNVPDIKIEDSRIQALKVKSGKPDAQDQ